MATLWIVLGSAIGGALRFWIAALAARVVEAAFGVSGFAFLGTVFVNVSGSFAIGFLASCGLKDWTRQLFIIGLLGGYTTFSSFSLETLELIHAGRIVHASGNVLLSVTLSLAAVWLGQWSGRAFGAT